MKTLSLLLAAMLISLFSLASELVLIRTGSLEKTKQAFSQPGLTIHFYNDDFAVGTMGQPIAMDFVVIDDNAWDDPGSHYYILHFDASARDAYFDMISPYAGILHQGDGFFIVSAESQSTMSIIPGTHGGIISIQQMAARFPANTFLYKEGSLVHRNYITDLLNEVDTANLHAYVLHLQNYGTRNAYKNGSILAQNWIYDEFESFGLAVELHDFSMPGGPASDNVIATLTGTKYPDEYVVLGAHYDSYASGNNEPGADDNATGTAGILEIARILSQYEFDRSIIFATWSGEEYGLYGSAAWASQAANNGMNILGYFNIDMAGYLQAGSYIHTDLIGPASASELKQFYKDVCAIYLPDFPVEPGALSGGDSDHTSFNNNGYQGIFPFEDSQNYSPYIHTSNDLIGPSVNNFEQHGVFVQATLASVVSMANMLPSPENLAAIAGDGQVDLSWTGVDSVDHYNIYRNGGPTPFATAQDTFFVDTTVTNGTSYTYYVTAVFMNTGEESGASNLVTVIPMPPIALPFFDDFETGAPYWTMEGSWGLRSGYYYSPNFSVTESPTGSYQNSQDISLTLRSIDLTGAFSASLSFWCRYSIESGYDYTYLEISKNGTSWTQLASFTGTQNSWTQKSYNLSSFLGEPNVIIRFRFFSDVYVTADGMHIDDLEIAVSGVGLNDSALPAKNNIHIHPNPATEITTISYVLPAPVHVKLSLADASGKLIRMLSESVQDEGVHQFDLNVSGLPAGMYQVIMDAGGQPSHRKLVISR